MQNIAELQNNMITPNSLGIWAVEFHLKNDVISDVSQSLMDHYLQLRSDFWENSQIAFQIFDQSTVISQDHLKMVVYHVDKAFNLQMNISNQPSTEFLLYLSHQRQIQMAIEKVGVQNAKDLTLVPSFGAILFGPADALPDAIQLCLSSFNDYDVSAILPKTYEEILAYFDRNNISNAVLLRFLQFYNYSILPDQEISELIKQVPEDLFNQIAVEIVNELMVKLFLSNQKEKNGK